MIQGETGTCFWEKWGFTPGQTQPMSECSKGSGQRFPVLGARGGFPNADKWVGAHGLGSYPL